MENLGKSIEDLRELAVAPDVNSALDIAKYYNTLNNLYTDGRESFLAEKWDRAYVQLLKFST